jgi:hypothetical protein
MHQIVEAEIVYFEEKIELVTTHYDETHVFGPKVQMWWSDPEQLLIYLQKNGNFAENIFFPSHLVRKIERDLPNSMEKNSFILPWMRYPAIQ